MLVPASRGGAGHHVFAHWNLCRRAALMQTSAQARRLGLEIGGSANLAGAVGDPWFAAHRQPRLHRGPPGEAPPRACFAVMAGGETVVANQRRASDAAGGSHWLAAEEPAPGNPDTSGSRERRLAEPERTQQEPRRPMRLQRPPRLQPRRSPGMLTGRAIQHWRPRRAAACWCARGACRPHWTNISMRSPLQSVWPRPTLGMPTGSATWRYRTKDWRCPPSARQSTGGIGQLPCLSRHCRSFGESRS